MSYEYELYYMYIYIVKNVLYDYTYDIYIYMYELYIVKYIVYICVI